MKSYSLMALMILLIVGCQPDNRAAVDAFLDDFTSWNITLEDEVRQDGDTQQFTSSRTTSTNTGVLFPIEYVYTCQLTDVSRSASFERVFVPGFTVADVLPGALIQGQALRDGRIAILPLTRSDIELRVDVAIDDATLTVESPATSNAIYDAVTQFRQNVDSRISQTNIDLIAANLEYQLVEAFSYEQALLDLGMSAEYAGESVQASLSTSFSTSNTERRHTVMARLFHSMYTIVFDDSRVTPADLLADDVAVSDLEQEVAQGRLSTENLPLYIKSVTYGQMILFTVSSSTVESASDLESAVSVVVGAFKGESTLDQSTQSILQNSEINVYSIGGDRETAFSALRNGNLSEFFNPAPGATAQVLYMTANTLDGNRAALVDRASFTERTCDAGQAMSPDWYLVVENAEHTHLFVERFVEGGVPARVVASGSRTMHLNPLFYGGVNTFIIRNDNNNADWPGFGTTANIFIYRGSPSNPANLRYELRVDHADWPEYIDLVTFRIYTNPAQDCEIRMDYGRVWYQWDGNNPLWRPCEVVRRL